MKFLQLEYILTQSLYEEFLSSRVLVPTPDNHEYLELKLANSCIKKGNIKH